MSATTPTEAPTGVPTPCAAEWAKVAHYALQRAQMTTDSEDGEHDYQDEQAFAYLVANVLREDRAGDNELQMDIVGALRYITATPETRR